MPISYAHDCGEQCDEAEVNCKHGIERHTTLFVWPCLWSLLKLSAGFSLVVVNNVIVM
jgi:hypothetical protein